MATLHYSSCYNRFNIDRIKSKMCVKWPNLYFYDIFILFNKS